MIMFCLKKILAAIRRNNFLLINDISRAYGILRTNVALTNIKLPQIHGPCFVLGSAPNPSIPDSFDKTWTFMTVNASQVSLNNLRIRPDFTVMSDYMLGDSPANTAGKEVISGMNTSSLILTEKGYSADVSKARLNLLNYKYNNLFIISHWQRSNISHRITGKYLSIGKGEQQISTGIFAALLAYYLGARPVVLSGFSFSTEGHAYNNFGHKRHHVNFDKVALSIVKEKRLPIFTADKNFSLESGLSE